jgi:transcriptional regulator with XRE-family HTH domain
VARYLVSDSHGYMMVGQQILRRLAVVNISQAELARRVGMSQSAMHNLISGKSRSSTHIHKIARELATTPAYLTGETEDPASEGVDAPVLDVDSRVIADNLHHLRPSNRRAIAEVVRSLAELGRPEITPSAALPSEQALTEMFEALLEGIAPETSLIERAQLLAKRLPIGLSQLHDVQTDSSSPASVSHEEQASPATLHREPQS